MALTEIDFLTFAQSFNEENEVCYRNAISKAYQAAYHYGLKRYGLKLENSPELIAYLLDSPDPEQRQVAYLLKQLQALSVAADYQLQETITAADKECVLGLVETLLGFLQVKSKL